MRWFTRRRIAWMAGGLLVFLLLAGISAVLILRSDWFLNKVRLKLIATVETATGGKVEIGSLNFAWRRLRAEARDLVVHGTEPAGKPPLFRASSVLVGLKLISIWKPNVDIQYLDVTAPRIYLIIARDGRTNIPEPKVRSPHPRPATETLLDAAIGRFRLDRGLFEIEGQAAAPFDLRGEKLNVQLAYELLGPRYRGTVSIAPLHVRYDDYGPEPFQVNLAVTMEKNRIAVDSGRLSAGATQIDLSGALEDLTAPRARFQYQARAGLTDIGRIFRVKELRRGRAQVNGSGQWSPAAGLTLTGDLHATDVEYRDSTIRLTGFRAQGPVSVGPDGVAATRLALSGNYVRGQRSERIEGHIGDFRLRNKDVEMRGVALSLLSGSFRGDVHVRELDRFVVEGAVSGLEARRAASLFTPEALPWNALAFGPVRLEGSLKRSSELRASAQLTIAPAPSGDKVSGQINAVYEARGGGNLDLGRSTLSLPHTRADFSGSLGRELTVHLETTDLNDTLPALGQNASTLPVRLNNGGVVFDGTVTGNLRDPHIAGHVRATNVVYQQESVDSFEADVQLARDYLRLQNGRAARGALRAQLQGALGLTDWNTTDASPVSATGSISNVGVADLLAAARVKDVPLTGTVNGSGAASGTLGKLRAEADITALNGAYKNERFDRFTAHATYAENTLAVTAAQLTAGARQVQFTGDYHHSPGRFDEGRVRFQLNTNGMAVDQIQTVAEQRSDLKGTVQLAATGDIELTPGGSTPYRINALHADLSANGIQLGGQPVGNAHLTANSQGQTLRAHVESTVAGSTVRGDGEWQLTGELPGSATLQFSRVDLAGLKHWISPGDQPPPYAGFAEGEFRVEGPVQRWQALRGELRIRQFQISAAPGTAINGQSPTLRNAGDLVFNFANSAITAANAHFVGPGTDLSLTGRIQPEQPAPLDLRVDGKVDLAFLHDFFPDFTASGGVATSATIRGAFADPQLFGRMQFQDATFNIADVPNGISKATGTITFNKDRATIENLTGETGGGRIRLTGFASYGGSRPAVFRLHARANEVRVRYPEGVSTVADADLNLTGTSDNSVLSGTVTILRTGINLQSDFSSILAKSAEPVRTPSAQTGLLGGMSFDIQIDTSPDLQLQSSLAEDIQMEANLKLRGTATNPALLGRINITQGKISFFGTQYTVNQGSISFYNPVKVEPILNIDLETRARGIDITLTISGPLNKLVLTPRSDPPLQFSEIVALLAMGRTPTSDPSLWSTQSTIGSQTWSQMGASALLGSAIANPVAGRLQRFFGVSKLRIDPTITGVENTPQARVTLEQQVSPSVTFTYISNVTTSNPQVIRVEWALSREWSAVALREENGLFGLDFVYKRRFK
jgi:translocation and assembly module TamB